MDVSDLLVYKGGGHSVKWGDGSYYYDNSWRYSLFLKNVIIFIEMGGCIYGYSLYNAN